MNEVYKIGDNTNKKCVYFVTDKFPLFVIVRVSELFRIIIFRLTSLESFNLQKKMCLESRLFADALTLTFCRYILQFTEKYLFPFVIMYVLSPLMFLKISLTYFEFFVLFLLGPLPYKIEPKGVN
jgi:hypothetical protein